MSLKEILSKRYASKAAFDEMLVGLDSRNSDCIGRAEVRNPDSRTITEGGREYALNPVCYFADGQRFAVSQDFAEVLNIGLDTPTGAKAFDMHFTRWWMVREYLRYSAGVYETTSPLMTVFKHFPHLMPHMRPNDEDKLAVYYTPDAQAGERDVQVQTTIGRLVRKLYPHISDDVVRDVEATHRAEVFDEIEFLTGENLVHCYEKQTPRSWSNCMGKNRNVWGSLSGHHPTEAYDAPGFALAVARKVDGSVAARCLTWTNPQNEADKRYVRLYGDSSLERRLRRHGFRPAGLEGARLRKIVISSTLEHEQVVVPYLDRVGGSSGGEMEGTEVVLDGDWLLVVGTATKPAFRRAGVSPINAMTTYGTVTIPRNCCTEALSFVCALTGVRHKRDTTTVYVVKSIGEHAGLALYSTAVDKVADGWRFVYRHILGEWREALAAPDVPTFTHNSRLYVDEPVSREVLGYRRLAPRYYPDSYWTLTASRTFCVGAPDSDDVFEIAQSDAVDAIVMRNGEPTLFKYHKSEVADKKVWSVVHRVHEKFKTYLHKDVPFVTTGSGRRVVPDIHNVTQLFDGRWEFWRNVSDFYVFDRTFRKRVDETLDVAATAATVGPKILGEFVRRFEMIDEDAAESTSPDYALRKKSYYLQWSLRGVFGGVPTLNDAGEAEIISVSTWRTDQREVEAIENMRQLAVTIDRAISENRSLTCGVGWTSEVNDLLLKTIVRQLINSIFGAARGEVRVIGSSDVSDTRFAVAA